MSKERKFKRLMMIAIMLLISGSIANAQCNLSASAVKACRGTSIQFSIPATTTFSSIKWSFGNGDSSVQPTNAVTYIYDTFGTFTACVTLYNSNGTVKCGPSCLPITIFDPPSADMILPTQTTMCFENNRFDFFDKSTPGKSKAPISKWLWDFGDGDSSTTRNPIGKSYGKDGYYTIILKASDTNGCWDTVTKTTSIRVLPKLDPKFTTSFSVACPETPVRFTNTTDTNGKNIVSWRWDFGDGSSTDTVWGKPSFIHVYKRDGASNPKLVVVSAFGCTDSIIKYSGAKNIFYYFDIKKSESGPVCWEGNNLCYQQKPRPNAYYWLWQFDDPPSMLLNTNDEAWDPCHHYTAPGVYHVSLKIWEPNCIRDTTFCTYIPLKGPQAIINMPSPPFPANNQLQAKPIPISFWHAMSSKCLNPNGDPIDYVTRTQVAKFTTGTLQKYCNSLLDSANFDTTYKPYPCPLGNSIATGMNFPLLSGPVSSTPIYDSIKETPGTWFPGQQIPVGVAANTVYYPKSGTVNYKTMHDTDLNIHNCSGPNYVRFTNNSYKYRMYYAIDNQPFSYFPYPTKQAEIKFDECYNPSYPWASDSMLYWWDFTDGPSCTSTVAKPNINCKFSNEVQPWHLFKEDGCYSVSLQVIDTVTACTSNTTVNIVMEPPVSSWEINKFGLWKGKNPAMDWITQRMTPPALGKRGVILNGTPCVGNNYPQVPSFSETRPTCDRQFWWMVFDSLANGFGGCGTPTLMCKDVTKLDIDRDGKIDTIENHVTYDCGWVDMITFMMMGNKWVYGKGGWKTIGLIIKTGDCFDTFFYHNYKYVYDLNYSFNINDPYKKKANGEYPPLNYNMNEHLRLCPNMQAILTVADTTQVGITKFRFYIDKYFPPTSPQWPAVNMEDSCKLTRKDTIYNLCHKDSFTINPFTGKKEYTYCFMYPDVTKSAFFSWAEWLGFKSRGFIMIDTFPQMTLKDSFFMKQAGAPGLTDLEPDWSLTVPGKYKVTATIKNIYGCASGGAANIIVGHYADFDASDKLICYEGGGDTVVFRHTVRYFWIPMTPFEPDLNPNEYWVDPINSLGTFDPVYGDRTGPPKAPYYMEKVEWDFGDGKWYKNEPFTDSIFHVFNKPADYTIRMKTTDSNGCVQILERKAYIKVVGILADFDTAVAVTVCAPQTVKFLDQSIHLNAYKYIYNSSGVVIDSTLVDPIKNWTWDFYDGIGTSQRAFMQNPIHTYQKNGTFDVRLIVKTTNGCVDTISKPSYINILGPKPKFWLYKNGQKVTSDTICKGDYIVVLDSSDLTTNWQFIKGDQTIFSDSVKPANNQWAIQYTKPGTYRIYLNATAKVFFPIPAPGFWGYCTSAYADSLQHADDPTFIVVVNDIPPSAFGGDTIICSGDVAEFADSSDNQYSTIAWNYGDGSPYHNSTPGLKVTHPYIIPGYDTNFTVELDAQGVFCPDKIKKANIRVMRTDAIMNVVDNKMPIYTFGNTSKGGNQYKWTVKGTAEDGHVFNEEYLTQSNEKYVFDFGNYKGDFEVCLYSWIEVPGLNGCLDTSCVIVPNTFEVLIEIPNVFTPNGDGENDEFTIKTQQIEYYDITIFNRWGEKMFESQDATIHWNGNNINSGKTAPTGTYYYVLNYQLRGEKQKSQSGTVTLMR